MNFRVVPLPVSVNASNTTENTGMGIGKYQSEHQPIPCDLLVAKRYPATSQLAQFSVV